MKKVIYFIFIGICLLWIRIIFAHDNNLIHPFTLTGKSTELLLMKTGGIKLPDGRNDYSKSLYYELFIYFYDTSMPEGYEKGDGGYDTSRLVKKGTYGTWEADKPSDRTFNHFYNPASGKKFWLGTLNAIDNAKEFWDKGMEYYREGNKSEAYKYFGVVLHHLEDMSSPAHVYLDQHWLEDYGYENYWHPKGNTPEETKELREKREEEFGEIFSGYSLSIKEAPMTSYPYGNAFQLSLDDYVHEMAKETYEAVRIEGILYRDGNNPAGGELGRMFPESGGETNVCYLQYVKAALGLDGYWKINNVGNYNKALDDSNEWWPIEDTTDFVEGESAYFYIEQPANAIPSEYKDEVNEEGKNLCQFWGGYPEYLMPKTVEYVAGLMKYFYDVVNPPDTQNPSAITNLAAQSCDKQIKLTWQSPADGDFAGVEIYRSSVELTGLSYESVSAVCVRVYEGGSTEFTDVGILNGQKYYYIAYAEDTAGNHSEGAMVSGIPSRDSRVKEAINRLRNVDEKLTRGAIITLVRLRGLSIEALIELTRDIVANRIARIGAMSCLGRIGVLDAKTTGREVSAIIFVIDNGFEEDLRMAGAIVLGYFGTAESRNKLRELLSDGDEEVRLSAAGALGMLGDESGYSIAVRAAESGDIYTRSRGIMALGYIGKEEGREIISLAGQDLRLWETIIVAMRQLDLTQSRAAARTRGGEIEDRTAMIEGLRKGLSDSHIAVREWALNGLLLDMDRNNKEVEAILVGIAKDKNHIASRSVRKELDARGIEIGE